MRRLCDIECHENFHVSLTNFLGFTQEFELCQENFEIFLDEFQLSAKIAGVAWVTRSKRKR
jgi:hypothetical protein